jgi:hypothetical protein
MQEKIRAERDLLVSMYDVETHGAKSGQLYAASMALSWVLDPDQFSPPSDYINRIRLDSADCSLEARPARSPGISAAISDAS